MTDSTVRACIDTRAEMHGDSPFLVAPEPEVTLDYAGLQRQCQWVEAQLATLGLVPGDKVAFLLDNGYWTTSLFLGTMYAGLVSVPVNAVAGNQLVRYILAHSDARVLFCSERHHTHLAEAIDTCPPTLSIIETDEDTGPDWRATAVTARQAPLIASDDDALLLYTSGTTGVPKGARLSHRAVLAGGCNTALAHALGPADRALCVLPLYHINGEIVTVMGPLVSGGSVVMPHRFRVSQFWSLVRQTQCSWASLVPTIITYLLDRATRDDADGRIDVLHTPELRQLRFARSASAPLPAAVQQQFEAVFGIPMIETMGLTETCAPILSNPLPPAIRKPGSPGIPFGNEVVVADERGRPVADYVAGELLVRGANVLSGYYKDDVATGAAFWPGGWFRTGDIGYRDDEGYLFVNGRLKELIIKGGENIAPREIDDALYQHEAVLEAAAIGVDDDAYGQDVQACVRLREGFEAQEQELIEHCQQQVGAFKAPRRVHFLADLPKGPSGKIQRLKLAAIVAGQTNTAELAHTDPTSGARPGSTGPDTGS